MILFSSSACTDNVVYPREAHSQQLGHELLIIFKYFPLRTASFGMTEVNLQLPNYIKNCNWKRSTTS